MYGAILGDIIGQPFEFDRGNKTKDFPLFRQHPTFTDDSVMTIAICDKVYVILFDSPENRCLEHGTKIDPLLTVSARCEQVKKAIAKYPNVEFRFINTDECVKEDGSEDWDKETPLVIDIVGNDFKFVFSSEPSCDEYFKRAYPWATHVIVDEKRIHVPISGTEVRTMTMEEAVKWLA